MTTHHLRPLILAFDPCHCGAAMHWETHVPNVAGGALVCAPCGRLLSRCNCP